MGRYFQEHPRFDAGLILPTDPQMRIGFYEPHEVGKTTILGYLTLSSATAPHRRARRRPDAADADLRPGGRGGARLQRDDIARDLLDRIEQFGGLKDLTEGIGPDLAKLAADLMSWQQR